jgi:hypothetical protein
MALLLAEEPALADVFRYVDREGRIHEVKVADEGSSAPRLPAPSPGADPSPRAERSPGADSLPDAALPWLPAAPSLDYPYAALIREAAALYSLPVELILAVMRVESRFDPDAVSRSGAMGLMQLMPATAEELEVRDPFDPRQNILGGARFLRILVNAFDGDLAGALAAYNAGPGALQRNGGVPPTEETRQYVVKVLSHYHYYLDEGPSAAARAARATQLARAARLKPPARGAEAAHGVEPAARPARGEVTHGTEPASPGDVVAMRRPPPARPPLTSAESSARVRAR